MDKPNRAQILDDTRENYGLMIKEGYNPDTIRDMVFKMYLKVGKDVKSILSVGREKKVAILTLQEINARIAE